MRCQAHADCHYALCHCDAQYGGIPLWLREDRRTVFRTNDTTWQYEMNVFTSVVMRYVQPFLARNGGPIILAQIEVCTTGRPSLTADCSHPAVAG